MYQADRWTKVPPTVLILVETPISQTARKGAGNGHGSYHGGIMAYTLAAWAALAGCGLWLLETFTDWRRK